MCGIYGQIVISGNDRNFEAQGRISTDTLQHRGPDERGMMFSGRVFLGMRRLSIIDLSGGSQPIWNESKECCVVYNGELYNFRELRALLETHGYVFRTGTDTEVVLRAYEQWGTGALSRFNGMFSIAIWDARKGRLFLARDRIGEKPLYYFHDGERLIFASEIKAILADPTVPRCLNPKGLANFLSAGHSIAPETIYQSIFKLPPGHWLTVREGEVSIRRYWDVGDSPWLPQSGERSEDVWAGEVLNLLDDSVRRRMVADVPVGAFLSGGVDSSAIVALMQRHSNRPVKTFSLGFGIGGAYNELSDARLVAKALGTEHYELNVEHCDLVATLRKLVWHYDEPFGDPACFPLYLLSRFAAEQVKVVLSGDGGDELFGGYRRYAFDRFAGLYQRLPNGLIRRAIPALAVRLPRLRRVKRALSALPVRDPARRYAAWMTVFTPEMRNDLLTPEVRASLEGYDAEWPYASFYGQLKSEASDHLNRLMYVDFKTLLADAYMEKADKATMACSLEARLPILDPRLVELAFQIPGSAKICGSEMKHLFKKAVSGLVPREVLSKPKHGFAVPLDPWFRGALKAFAFEVLLDGSARRRGYFDLEVIERLWREHGEGRHVWDAQLWLLLNFELWHRIYLDGESV